MRQEERHDPGEMKRAMFNPALMQPLPITIGRVKEVDLAKRSVDANEKLAARTGELEDLLTAAAAAKEREALPGITQEAFTAQLLADMDLTNYRRDGISFIKGLGPLDPRNWYKAIYDSFGENHAIRRVGRKAIERERDVITPIAHATQAECGEDLTLWRDELLGRIRDRPQEVDMDVPDAVEEVFEHVAAVAGVAATWLSRIGSIFRYLGGVYRMFKCFNRPGETMLTPEQRALCVLAMSTEAGEPIVVESENDQRVIRKVGPVKGAEIIIPIRVRFRLRYKIDDNIGYQNVSYFNQHTGTWEEEVVRDVDLRLTRFRFALQRCASDDLTTLIPKLSSAMSNETGPNEGASTLSTSWSLQALVGLHLHRERLLLAGMTAAPSAY
jgi:hypothetical protein